MSDDIQPTTNAFEGEVVNQSTPLELTVAYDLKVAAKIYEAFNNRYNISEACAYAGISRQTFYNWLEWHPEFAVKVEEAKAMPNRRAKEVVVKAIDEGDVNTARWLLDRTDPDFKPKMETDNTHELKKTREKIKDFLDEPDSEYRESNASGEQPTAEPEPSQADEVPPAPPDIS